MMAALGMMNVGDVIFVYDEQINSNDLSTVLSNTGTVVDCADGTAITAIAEIKDRGRNPPTLIWQ